MIRNKFVRGVAVGIVAFLAALSFQALHLLLPLEWKSWDLRQKIFADPSRASKEIVLVLIDQYSLDIYNKQQGLSWPWPRQMHAALVDYLKAGGAAACFFDIAMTEPSGFGVEDDRAFRRAMAEAGNVFLPIALSTEDRESAPDAVSLLRRFSLSSPLRVDASVRYRSVTAPLPVLLPSAKGVGNVRVNPDDDGIYRRIPLASRWKDMTFPSVPLVLASLFPDQASPLSVPLDSSGRMILRFWGPAVTTYRTYPMATLINSFAQLDAGSNPQIPPSEFSGKIVLVGLSAVGLLDLKSSPLSAVISGVEIQAAALDTLLNRHFFRIFPPAATMALVLVLAVLSGWVLSSLRRIGGMAAAMAGVLALPAAAAALAFVLGAWLDFVFPESAVLLAVVGSSVLNYGIEGKKRRFIKGAFRQYLSPTVVDKVLANPGGLELGGEEREITSFFSDVEGFTSISEKLSPHSLVSLMNIYLSEMTEIIMAAGGTLDKYEGDAIIAFWNAPLDDPAHALRACRAALACQKRTRELNPDLRKNFGHEIRMRIGLNTGPAVVGNMGSRRRFDYTAIGDTVNLASRLEGACKQYRIFLLIGETTRERAGDAFLVREADFVRVVGRVQPVRIFELLGERDDVPPAEIEAVRTYGRALESFRRRRWDQAGELFRSLGKDPLAAIYIERSEVFLRNPPPAEWDGVVELKTK